MGILKNKHILITGLSNKFSISYGIAKSMYQQGAKLAFSYQNDRLKNKIKKITDQFKSDIILKCDVNSDESIKELFYKLKKKWTKFDGLVHSIAYAPKEQLNGDYVELIDRKSFNITHETSSYSFVGLIKNCKEMLNKNSSIVSLTYLGSNRVVPNYNIMGLAKASLEANIRYTANSLGPYGIRVNGISSGPIKTLASSAIKNFKKMLSYYKLSTPIKRLVTIQDIGNCASFLCSDLSAGITGEILHVDGGFNMTMLNRNE